MKKEKTEDKDILQDNLVDENLTPEQEDLNSSEKDEQDHGSEENLKEEIQQEIGEVDKIKDELEQIKDKYLRLYSEFDNFRRRTAKEKVEMVKTANEDLLTALLPIVDDFERAKKASEAKDNATAALEGYGLIYNKLMKNLNQKGLTKMELSAGSEFNPEFHEAITQIPAHDEKLKGKIVDVIEQGYYLGDKVIRYAKVVIGM